MKTMACQLYNGIRLVGGWVHSTHGRKKQPFRLLLMERELVKTQRVSREDCAVVLQ